MYTAIANEYKLILQRYIIYALNDQDLGDIQKIKVILIHKKMDCEHTITFLPSRLFYFKPTLHISFGS